MNENWEEYVKLRDAALEGRASREEIARLESFVLSSEAMKRDFVEHRHMQVSLPFCIGAAGSGPLDVTSRQAIGRSPKRVQGWLALAVVTISTLGAAWLWRLNQAEEGFAMIIRSESCRWGECESGTAENRPLGAGRMRLLEGIATLRFPHVEVTLEGAVDIELIDAKKCLLHSGRVYADVKPGGEGFMVETPTALLVDQGTVFGVNVLPSGASDVKVFEGRVDVDHFGSGDQMAIVDDEYIRLSSSSVGPVEASVEQSFRVTSSATESSVVESRPIHVSTASGLGDDAYVSPGELPEANRSSTALLIKRPANLRPGGSGLPWRRKAFLRFDLRPVDEIEIEQASLHLHGVATDIGFTSLMPDAKVNVYGLIDESQDGWGSQSITWGGSPAQAGDRLDVDETEAILIGSFVVPQAKPEGRFEVSGDRLVRFLQSDTNGSVTLILVPQTEGEGAAYVHGFASKRHPELPAPTLRLGVRP